MWVPALRRTADALHRVRDKSRPYFLTQITRTTDAFAWLDPPAALTAPTVDGGPICASACEAAKPEAAIINVAESTDLMTNPGECCSETGERVIDVPRIKPICLVGNNRAPVQRGD
jgi:hypothetical protein